MIFEKLLMTLAAAAAIAATAGVAVVAAAFALYALLEPSLGPAGAAAAVAAGAALLIALAGLIAAAKAKSRPSNQGFGGAQSADLSLIWKVVDMAKQRPLIAASIALAAGVFVLRNPSMVAAVIKAMLEPRAEAPPKS